MKQEIRQKFANEITKYFKKLQTEKESASTINKSLYFILILTISLTSCNEQQQNVKLSQSITFNNSISSITSLTQPSDLEQALLTISSLLLSKPYKDTSNLKLILYYTAKLLKIILEGHSKAVDNYISCNKYLDLIITVLKRDELLTKDEKFLFLKEILLCLGLFFKNLISLKKPPTTINNDNINLLICYYATSYTYLIDYVFQMYKKLKNVMCNINNLPNFHSNLNINNSIAMANEEETTLKTKETLFKKETNFIAFNALTRSFYYFVLLVTKDITIGKHIFNQIHYEFTTQIANADKHDKLCEIMIVYILQKSQKTQNEIHKTRPLVGSIFEFISGQIVKTKNDFYLGLLFEHFEDIIRKDANLRERCEIFIADIFIAQIVSNERLTIIEKINQFASHSKRCNVMLMESLFLIDFIYNVSNRLMSIVEFQQQNRLLLSLIDIITYKPYMNVNDVITDASHGTTGSLIHKNKIALNTQKFIAVIKNIGQLPSVKAFSGQENVSIKINYIRFYKLFYTYATSNCEFEPENDKELRKHIYISSMRLIYDLMLYNCKYDINKYTLYSKDIINLVQLLVNFITDETDFNIYDSYLIFTLLSSMYKQLNKEQDITKTTGFIAHVYKVTFSVLIIIVNKYKLPISPIHLNNDVKTKTEQLYKQNPPLFIAFSDEEVSTLMKQLLQNFNEFVFTLEQIITTVTTTTTAVNAVQRDYNITSEQFKQIVDILYSTLFGYSSVLNSFYESQEDVKQMTMENYNMLGSARIKESKLDLDNITVTEGNISLFDERLVSNDNLFNLTLDNNNINCSSKLAVLAQHNNNNNNQVTTHRTTKSKVHLLEKVSNKDNKCISVRDITLHNNNNNNNNNRSINITQQDDKGDGNNVNNSGIIPFNYLNANNYEGLNILSVLSQHNNNNSYLDSEDVNNIQI